jgi:hypothetical protein
VYNGDKKEFVSCGHNFRKVKCVNFIRLYNEKIKIIQLQRSFDEVTRFFVIFS